MSSTLIVPSDISICERKYRIEGERSLTIMERLGNRVKLPIFRPFGGFNGLSRAEERRAMQFVASSDTPAELLDIFERRQKAISAISRSRVFTLAGMAAAAGLAMQMTENYNGKSKGIVLMPALYGGSILGRVTGGLMTGTVNMSEADRALADLAVQRFY